MDFRVDVEPCAKAARDGAGGVAEVGDVFRVVAETERAAVGADTEGLYIAEIILKATENLEGIVLQIVLFIVQVRLVVVLL